MNSPNVIFIATADSSGTVTEYYDQIACNVQTVAGNIRMASYDDSAVSPNNLLSETADQAVLSGYQYRTMPEFALATATVWLAHNTDNSSFRRYRTAGGVYTIGTGKSKSFTYGAYPNPAGSGYSNNSGYKYTMKIAHS